MLAFIFSSRQPFWGRLGKSQGCQAPSKGSRGQACGGEGLASSMPRGKAQVNPFGDTSLGKCLRQSSSWGFPISNLKNQM